MLTVFDNDNDNVDDNSDDGSDLVLKDLPLA